MKTIKKIIFFILITVIPNVSRAQTSGGNPIRLNNPLKSNITSLPQFITVLLEDVVVPMGAVIVVLAIIYSGFLFVTAQGNQEKLSRAKKTFLFTVVGAAVLLGASVLAQVVTNTIKLLK